MQPALQTQTSQDAVNKIASDMARFYASDVLYVDYSVPEIIGALRAAGIAVGGLGGQQINSEPVPALDRLAEPDRTSPTRSTCQLPAAQKKPVTPGLHGHELNSVSVGGTTLQTGSTNSIPASPAPTFTLNFANTGQNTETNVMCKVTGRRRSKVSGQTIVPQTTAGQSTSCQVTLNGTPPKGTQQVIATIVPVPGEKTDVEQHAAVPGHVPVSKRPTRPGAAPWHLAGQVPPGRA